MNSTEIILIAVVSLLFLGSLVFLFNMLYVNNLNPHGKGAYKKTARILRKFGLIRNFRVMTNVSFAHKGKTYHIENMLIGFFGILLVHTLGGRGEYYGLIDSKEWHRTLKEKKYYFPNPLAEQEEAITALRALLSQRKVYNIPMENIVYLTNRSKKTSLFITNDNKIFLPGKLAPYLRKTKFEKDTGLDVGKIVSIIEENSVKA